MTKIREVAAVVAQLENEKGEITPQIVVEAASDPDSLLHSLFDWDDTSAAHKYRIEQARQLLRSIRIQLTVVDRPVRVPAYLRDPDKHGDEQGYVNTARLRTDEEKRREALVTEFARAASALRRARDIASYFGEQEQVDHVLERVNELHAGAMPG